jgi:hypothetical protein
LNQLKKSESDALLRCLPSTTWLQFKTAFLGGLHAEPASQATLDCRHLLSRLPAHTCSNERTASAVLLSQDASTSNREELKLMLRLRSTTRLSSKPRAFEVGLQAEPASSHSRLRTLNSAADGTQGTRDIIFNTSLLFACPRIQQTQLTVYFSTAACARTRSVNICLQWLHLNFVYYALGSPAVGLSRIICYSSEALILRYI